MADRPRNLLAWFLEGFRAEMPTSIHQRGVWRDRVTFSEAGHGVTASGGSRLGSPRVSEGFRRLIEGSPYLTEVAEYEGHKDTTEHYAFPMRAALARLAGRGCLHEEHPFMAALLQRIAFRDGDVDGACDQPTVCPEHGVIGPIPRPVRRAYVETALHRLWTRYEIEPPARPISGGRVAAA